MTATITPNALADALGLTVGELCLFLAEEVAIEYERAANAMRRGFTPEDHLTRATHLRDAHAVAEAEWDNQTREEMS
jgi:hypothetical protein